jgi:hydrogenase maturation protease
MTASREPLLVGLGSPDRGDDGVGPAVVRAVARLGLPGVEVAALEDPTALIDLWSERGVVVVVDAVCSGAQPGSLVVLETGERDTPLPESAWAATGRGGTHTFGLAPVVELARALGRLPRRVVVVGIEAVAFDHGAPLSPQVARSVRRAAEVVTGLLTEAALSQRLAPHGGE